MNPFWYGRNLNAIEPSEFGIVLTELEQAFNAAEFGEAAEIPDYYQSSDARCHDAWLVGRLLYSSATDGLAHQQTILRAQLMEARFLSHRDLVLNFWSGLQDGERWAIMPPSNNERHSCLQNRSIEDVPECELVQVLTDVIGASMKDDLEVNAIGSDSHELLRGTARLVGIELYRRGGFPYMFNIHCEELAGSRLIDVFWDRIGSWQG